MVVTFMQILLVSFDLPFFLFNLSMIYFLSVRIKQRHNEFTGGFYVLFLVVSISDAIFYLNVSLSFSSFHYRMKKKTRFRAI